MHATYTYRAAQVICAQRRMGCSAADFAGPTLPFQMRKARRPSIHKISGKLDMRDRGNKPLYYCGSDNPTPEMLNRAETFFARAIEKNGGHPGFRSPRRQANYKVFDPASVNDGFGKMWLDCFRDFRGIECVMFPFRTAAKPRGRVTYNFKKMEAHRAMCLMAHGLPKEDGKTMALHSCGNGHLGCANPKHLYWGDQSDNNKDAHRHAAEGRQAA